MPPSQMTRDGRGESFTAQAYAALYNAIVHAECVPGSRLKIDELKRRYGIGSAPLREALSLLTSAGLVERIDQRGFRVAAVTREDFADILRSRCWMEERCLAESIRHGSREWEENVVLAHYRLSRTHRDSRASLLNSDWERAHKEFHMALIAGCGSPIMMEMCNRLYDRNIRYRALSAGTAYPGRDVAEEHGAIVEAVLDRDETKATALLIAHYTRTSSYLNLPGD